MSRILNCVMRGCNKKLKRPVDPESLAGGSEYCPRCQQEIEDRKLELRGEKEEREQAILKGIRRRTRGPNGTRQDLPTYEPRVYRVFHPRRTAG